MKEDTCFDESILLKDKELNQEELEKLQNQNKRLICDFKATVLEKEAKKNWDLFYKRNETRFFKDRNWTTREFTDLVDDRKSITRVLLEIGCGTGNFIFPLYKSGYNFKFLACDFSHKAIELFIANELYDDETKIKAFQTDITSDDIFKHVLKENVDIATLIFVLSSIHPNKFHQVLVNIFTLLKPGGTLLFRDYGLHDMTQIRFKPGHKISDNLYMRQDGTRSYFFSLDFVRTLVEDVGFVVDLNMYVQRRTINVKEQINVPRIFIQGKFLKPG